MQTQERLYIPADPTRVDRRVGRGYFVAQGEEVAARIGRLLPLQEVVGDIVLHFADILEKTPMAKTRRVVVYRRQQIDGAIVPGCGLLVYAHPAQGQPRIGVGKETAVEVETLLVAPIGQIGLFVVFEAVDGAVVVHVDAIEELRSVGAKAQEGFVVVGNAVGANLVVVLVEIGDKIVVLVPAGEDFYIAKTPALALPVGAAVLVVVVVDKLVALQLAVVVDETIFVDDIHRGAIAIIYIERFGVEKVGVAFFRQVGRPGFGARRGGAVLAQTRVGILAVAVV